MDNAKACDEACEICRKVVINIHPSDVKGWGYHILSAAWKDTHTQISGNRGRASRCCGPLLAGIKPGLTM